MVDSPVVAVVVLVPVVGDGHQWALLGGVRWPLVVILGNRRLAMINES